MTAEHPFMTAREVAAAFQMNPETVARWRRAGKLTTVGGQRPARFLRAEVEALLRGEPLTPEQLDQAREQALGGAQ